ncbi:glycosyltransferase [Streptococcus equi]|uniref:glycosyltransferase n=1 Tax=Streptococcus equi TaxID=1336 RepID=UPI0022AB6766|nr:glycosyltransferase [Streptococcus equi]
MTKKIIFTGGGTAGHVTLNLILIPKFIKDGWEVHYMVMTMVLSIRRSKNQVLMSPFMPLQLEN